MYLFAFLYSFSPLQLYLRKLQYIETKLGYLFDSDKVEFLAYDIARQIISEQSFEKTNR